MSARSLCKNTRVWCFSVSKQALTRTAATKTHWVEGRDIPLEDAMAKERPYCPPELMDSEDNLFFLYTSGSTGAPKVLLLSMLPTRLT